MELSREQYDKMEQVFGPCSVFYECVYFEEAKDGALPFESFKDYIDMRLTIESVFIDREYHDDMSSDESAELTRYELDLTKLVKELMDGL